MLRLEIQRRMTAHEILHKKTTKWKQKGSADRNERKLDNWTGDPHEVEEQVQSRWEAEQKRSKNVKSEYQRRVICMRKMDVGFHR